MKDLFDTDRFRVMHGKHFKLKDHSTMLRKPIPEKALRKALDDDRAHIVQLQPKLFAEKKQSLLLIVQAMDAAGKDSVVSHVLSGVNPQGCSVTSFKLPSSEERAHDFLWRHENALPERGMIAVHNRSHYEEVLVVKVHPEYLMAQNIPGINGPKDVDGKFWKHRYESIRAWEEHVSRQGTAIVKVFLNVGLDKQKERFLDRINDPAKNWKFNAADAGERAHWGEYQRAYQDAIRATASEHAPWYVVPADDQWQSRAIVGHIVRERLAEMDPRFPKMSAKAHAEFAMAKKALMAQ